MFLVLRMPARGTVCAIRMEIRSRSATRSYSIKIFSERDSAAVLRNHCVSLIMDSVGVNSTTSNYNTIINPTKELYALVLTIPFPPRGAKAHTPVCVKVDRYTNLI